MRSFNLFITMTILVFATVVKAASNSTDSPKYKGWTREPPGRGTFSILWSSLFTTFACVWTVQHPPVGVKRMSYKIKHMLYTLVYPEILTALAICEWDDARTLLKSLTSVPGYENWTMTHAFFTTMHGFQFEIEGEGLFFATKESLLSMAQSKRIPLSEIENIKEEDLFDRGKADIFQKLVVVMQSSWVVIQWAARHAEDLPVSPLEVTTVAYVLCSGVTYFAWWHKPVDVGLPIVIKINSPSADVNDNLQRADGYQVRDLNSESLFVPSSWIMGAIFGGIHCSAWNFHFPSHRDQHLWRSASVATAGAGVIAANVYNWAFSNGEPVETTSLTERLFIAGLRIVYFGLRLLLAVEVFSCLRELPSGVYQTVEWVQILPKFS